MKESIRLTYFDSYGKVKFDIDGKEYEYDMDPVHRERIQKMAKLQPGAALGQVKKLGKLVKGGKGENLEQLIKNAEEIVNGQA